MLRAARDFHGIDLAGNHWVTGRDSRTELAHSLDVATRVDHAVLRSLVARTRSGLSEVRLLTPKSYMAMGVGGKYDDFAARATELLAKLVGNVADEMTTLELTPRGGRAAPRASTRKVVSPTKVSEPALPVAPGYWSPEAIAARCDADDQHVPFGYEKGKADDVTQVERTSRTASSSAPRRGRSPGSAPPKAKPASSRRKSSSGSRRPPEPPSSAPASPLFADEVLSRRRRMKSRADPGADHRAARSRGLRREAHRGPGHPVRKPRPGQRMTLTTLHSTRNDG